MPRTSLDGRHFESKLIPFSRRLPVPLCVARLNRPLGAWSTRRRGNMKIHNLHPLGKRESVLGALCFLTILSTQLARAADTVVSFDDFPPNTVITTQYATKFGVVFDAPLGPGCRLQPWRQIIQLPSGVAQSGTQALNITAVAEVSTTGVCGYFPTTTRQHVAAFVGDWGTTTHPVTLAVYDASGVEISEKTVTVTGGAGIHTQVTVSSSSANIYSFSVFVPGPPDTFARVAIDDLSFDNPTTPSGPDFGVVWPYGVDVGVTQGDLNPTLPSTYIEVVRTNGSTGGVQFSASGLPPGVSVSFSPNPSNGTSGATVALTFLAQSTASLVIDTPVTIVGTPLVATAGTQPHPVQIPLTVSGTYTLRVNGIEVTEGAQELALPTRDPTNPAAPIPYTTGFGGNGVNFDGSKAIVRVFADAYGQQSSISGVWAVLSGTDINNNPLPGSPILADFGPSYLIEQLCVDPRGAPCVPPSERNNPAAAFTFTLPDSWWLKTGISLTAQLLPPPETFQAAPFYPCITPDCLVLGSLTLTGITYTSTGAFQIAPLKLISQNSPLPDPWTVFNEARNVAPWDILLTDYQGTLDITSIMTSGCGSPGPPSPPPPTRDEINSCALNLVEDWDEDNGLATGDFTIGVSNTTQGLGIENGCVLFVNRCQGFITTNGKPLAVTDVKRPLTDVSHEIFHGFGIGHASGACGAQNPDPWPDAQGFLEGVGLDRRSGSGGIAAPYRVIAAPPNQFDIMSYCGGETNAWVSPINWDKAINVSTAGLFLREQRPIVEDGANHLVTVLPLFRTADLHRDSSEFPNVFSFRGAALQGREKARDAAKTAPTLTVLAFVSATGVHITHVKPGEGQPTTMAASRYHCLVRDALGHVLSDTPMTTRVGHIEHGGEVTFLLARVPAQGGARIEITDNGNVVASRTRSPHSPSVRLISPRPGDHIGQSLPAGPPMVAVRWLASDADGDALWVKVDYSADDGQTWKTVFTGQNRNEVDLPSSYFSGSTQARIRIRANDGFNEASAVVGSLSALGSPPVVHILDPLSGARYTTDSIVNLVGTAHDDSFHPLKADQLHWYALVPSIEPIHSGQTLLGSGEKLTVDGLPIGTESILLEARDDKGRIGNQMVPVQTTAKAPFFIKLDAPRALQSQDLSVTLGVAASRSSTLTIGSGHYQVNRQPTSITVPAPLSAKVLLLNLQLSSDGMTSRRFLRIVREPDPCQGDEETVQYIQQQIATIQDELGDPEISPKERARLAALLHALTKNLVAAQAKLKQCQQPPH